MTSEQYSLKLLTAVEEWAKKNEPEYDVELVAETKQIIQKTFNKNSVYPHISFGHKDELLLSWIAGNTHLHTILEDRNYFVSFRDNEGNLTQFDGLFVDFPYEFFAKSLAEFTTRVEKVNPKWKSNFQKL